MKCKIIAALLTCLLLTNFAGCSKADNNPPEKKTDTVTQVVDSNSMESEESLAEEIASSSDTKNLESLKASVSEEESKAEHTSSAKAESKPPASSAKQTESEKPASSEPPKQTGSSQAESSKPVASGAPSENPKETEPSKPSEPPAPSETEKPVESQPKTAYDYPFDIDTIRADCIAIGQSMGLTLDTSLTPENANWWNPVTASETSQGSSLKNYLEQYIRFHTIDNLSPYGLDEIIYFNIYCESRGNGVYSIYFLFT